MNGLGRALFGDAYDAASDSQKREFDDIAEASWALTEPVNRLLATLEKYNWPKDMSIHFFGTVEIKIRG